MRNLTGKAVLCTAGIFFSVSSLADATHCPETGHYYELVETFCNQPWVDAQAAAEASGGYLATVTSADEQACLGGLYNDVAAFWWLGGSDMAVEGEWRWVTGPETGELFSYTNWADGEPTGLQHPVCPHSRGQHGLRPAAGSRPAGGRFVGRGTATGRDHPLPVAGPETSDHG